MKHIRRLFRIHRIFVVQELKRMMEYKGDFIVGVIGFLMVQCSNLLFLWIIFNNIPNLLGWSLNEVVFIYGFSLIPKGIDHLFFDNLWAIGHFTVRKGDFDKYLTRPVNTLVHVLFEKLQIEWSVFKVLLGIAAVFFATFIFTGIKIITASVAFWKKRSGNIIYMVYMFNDFAKYPVTIYNEVIKNLITYIIPFAFTAYFPALYLLTGENPLYNVGMTVLMSLALMSLGVFVWHRGIRAYESAGS